MKERSVAEFLTRLLGCCDRFVEGYWQWQGGGQGHNEGRDELPGKIKRKNTAMRK